MRDPVGQLLETYTPSQLRDIARTLGIPITHEGRRVPIGRICQSIIDTQPPGGGQRQEGD